MDPDAVGMVGGVRLCISVLDFSGDRRRGMGSFGGRKVCGLPLGSLMDSCVEVRAPMELSLGMVSIGSA